MNVLNEAEIGVVSGGEFLFAPGEIGIALTDNTLVVISGIAEAQTALGVLGAVGGAFGAGYAIGTYLVDNTEIEAWLGNMAIKLFC